MMQTQNYEEKVKISGCKLRIMRKKSKYRDENSDYEEKVKISGYNSDL